MQPKPVEQGGAARCLTAGRLAIARIGREPMSPRTELKIVLAGPLTSLGHAAVFAAAWSPEECEAVTTEEVMTPLGEVAVVGPEDSLLTALEKMDDGDVAQLLVIAGGALRGRERILQDAGPARKSAHEVPQSHRRCHDQC
jgi:hypothetical protein